MTAGLAGSRSAADVLASSDVAAGRELVVEAADEGADEEAERERGSRDDGHRLRRIGAHVVQACRSKEDADEHRDQENEAHDASNGVHRVAAERAEKQIESQSENVCNHSRPSTSVRPPASSRKRCSSERSPRTSSTVPAAST